MWSKITQYIEILIKTSRPVGWIIAPTSFMLGLLDSAGELNWIGVFQILLLSFPYCILLYGINDVYDYESDKKNPRKQKFLQGTVLEPRYHNFVNKISGIVILILFFNSLLTFNIFNFIGVFILLLFSIFYSTPPLRFKERPPLDSFSNGIIYFLSPYLIGASFGSFSLLNFNQLFLITLCVAGVHSFSTLLDYDIEKKLEVKTFSLVFGKRIASLFALTMFLITTVFGNFHQIELNIYLIFCSLMFFITFIYPSQKIIALFFKLIFIGFFITALIYLL